MTRRKSFRYSIGRRGDRVVVAQRRAGGFIYARVFDPSARSGRGDYRWVSLRHRDEARAKLYAADQHKKLLEGEIDLTAGRVTLGRLFALYLAHQTPKKKRDEQAADRRRAACWTSFLGAAKGMRSITPREWDEFIARRSEGSLDAHGRPVAAPDRRRTRARTVAMDLIFLHRVCNWAMRWRDDGGHRLLDSNPLIGLAIPAEKNVRRPLADAERLARLRAIADRVWMRGSDGQRVRSYFAEVLDLAISTGRRVGSICVLTYADVKLTPAPYAPYGRVHWSSAGDKMGFESETPINATARAALLRILAERPGLGQAPLFPDPRCPTRPISRHVAAAWLRQAERLAGLEHMPGGGYHAFRRAFASAAARRGAALADLAAAAGWRDTATLQRSYLQADPASTLAVILAVDEACDAGGR